MENPTNNTYPILNELKQRWSPRAFSDKPVEKEKILSLLEAARWSPSSMNEQPWRFIVGIKGDKTWDMIFNTLGEWNQTWAGIAPVLIINLAKKTFTYKGRENASYQYDTGQAVAHMTIEAVNQGLVTHQMGGFTPEKAIELFEIPEDFLPVSVSAVGYIGDPELLPEGMKESELEERKRQNLNEMVFAVKYGESMKI